jgi:replicative DNA helicase
MEEAPVKRVMPNSIDAEKAVLGSMLLDKEATATAIEMLDKDDFYSKAYGIVFECMVELFNEGKPIDLVLIQNKLIEKQVPPDITGLDFFRGIMDSVPTSANIKNYSKIVKDKSNLRKLIKVSQEIVNDCYASEKSVDELFAKTENDIFKLLESKETKDIVPINEVVLKVLDKIESASKNSETVTGIPTGFIDLDYKTSGLQPSDLVLVAARPSMGKTAFVLNIVQNITMKKKISCMVFSLEMSAEQLVNRLLSMESNVDSQKLRTGNLNDNDWNSLIEGAVNVGSSTLAIDDTPGISINELRSKCRKMKLEKGLDIIIIDYLQLMSGSGKSNISRQQEISDISRSLKALAREMKAPVIALSQLSRACETRPDHRPMLSDLRESGAIEQDADVVMFLYRDDYYNKDTEHPNEAEVIIAKQRNGAIGTINLVWKPDITKFVNMAR